MAINALTSYSIPMPLKNLILATPPGLVLYEMPMPIEARKLSVLLVTWSTKGASVLSATYFDGWSTDFAKWEVRRSTSSRTRTQARVEHIGVRQWA